MYDQRTQRPHNIYIWKEKNKLVQKKKASYWYENGDRNKDKRSIFVKQQIDVSIFKNIPRP